MHTRHNQESSTKHSGRALLVLGTALAVLALALPAHAGTYCSTHLSSAESIIDGLDTASAISVTGSAAVETEMRANKAHDRYESFLINYVNRLNARCEDPVALVAPSYDGSQVPVSWFTKTVLVVHQAPADAGSSGAIANIGGVNRVINTLNTSDNLYVMADRTTYNADRRTATAHLYTPNALNYQSSSRPLTVIGGNFDASIPGAVRKVIDGFGSTNLNIDFPMDAIYLHFHGMTLQDVYESAPADPSDPPGGGLFKTWLKALINEKYVVNTSARVRLYLGNEGQYEYQMEELEDWPATAGDTRIVDFRVYIKQPDACEQFNPCSSTWTATQYYPSSGSFTKAEIGCIDPSDSCTVAWGNHTAFDNLGTLCRYTYGAPGDGRISVWSPIGTGICPTTVTVYSQTSGPIVEGSPVDFVFNLTIN